MYGIFHEILNINEISERKKDMGLQQYIIFTLNNIILNIFSL